MESSFSHSTHVMGKRRHRLGDSMLSTLTIFSFDRWSLAEHFSAKVKATAAAAVDLPAPVVVNLADDDEDSGDLTAEAGQSRGPGVSVASVASP